MLLQSLLTIISGYLPLQALDFLATTLEILTSKPGFDVILDHQVVSLLVNFFSATFENDHKAGVLASARALTSLVSARGFRASQAVQVLRRAASLGEDFRKMPQSTRLVLYRLVRLTILPDPADLTRQIPPSDLNSLFLGLLALCRAERDPSCLMAWFDVVSSCLVRYQPAAEVTKEAFSSLSQYFPISVRDTQSPTGITADDLKQALRRAFSMYHGMAEFIIPYLLDKLDQGEGLVLHVRADILRSLNACFSHYDHPARSVAPFADRTWSTLKFEVRNGDQIDAVKLALEALRTLTGRLQDDSGDAADLNRFLARVMADCLDEMTSPNHVETAGRLLAAVMSSKQAAFSELAFKIIPSLRAQIQTASQEMHVRDLVAVLNSILQLRPVVVDGGAAGDRDRQLGMTQDVLVSLYHNVYDSLIEAHLHDGAVQDDMTVVAKAIEGLALLVRQPDAVATFPMGQFRTLLHDDLCSEICQKLTRVYLERWENPKFDSVTEAVVLALSKISAVYPDSVRVFVSLGLPAHSELPTSAFLNSFVPTLVFIAHNEVAVAAGSSAKSARFLYVVEMLMTALEAAFAGKASPALWHQLALGILNSMLLFRKVSLAGEECASYSNFEQTVDREYSSIPRLGALESYPSADIPERPQSPYNDFVVVCYLVTKILYRRASLAVESHTQGDAATAAVTAPAPAQVLSADFQGTDEVIISAENSYLLTLSRIAKVAVEEVEKRIQPLQGRLSVRAFDLFRNPEPTCRRRLPVGRITQLSLGVVQGSQAGFPDSLLIPETSEHDDGLLNLFETGLLVVSHSKTSPDCYLVRNVLANIANKSPIEEQSRIRTSIETILNGIVDGSSSDSAAGRLPALHDDRLIVFENILAVLGGIARRLRADHLGRVYEALVRAPDNPVLGRQFARRMGLILASSLDEESACVKKLPTWKQRLYFSLVRPLVTAAMPKAGTGVSDVNGDNDVATRSRLVARQVAAVAAARYVPLAAMDKDTASVLRVAVCVAREPPRGGRDTALALAMLRDLVVGAPDAARGMASTLVAVVAEVLTAPLDGPRASAAIRELALDLLSGVARLEGAATAVGTALVLRLLGESAGWETRALRQRARLALAAWNKTAQ